MGQENCASTWRETGEPKVNEAVPREGETQPLRHLRHPNRLSPSAPASWRQRPSSGSCLHSPGMSAAPASAGKADKGDDVREQDRFLPIGARLPATCAHAAANISRIMKRSLPPNAKVSREAKETVQVRGLFLCPSLRQLTLIYRLNCSRNAFRNSFLLSPLRPRIRC